MVTDLSTRSDTVKAAVSVLETIDIESRKEHIDSVENSLKPDDESKYFVGHRLVLTAVALVLSIFLVSLDMVRL